MEYTVDVRSADGVQPDANGSKQITRGRRGPDQRAILLGDAKQGELRAEHRRRKRSPAIQFPFPISRLRFASFSPGMVQLQRLADHDKYAGFSWTLVYFGLHLFSCARYRFKPEPERGGDWAQPEELCPQLWQQRQRLAASVYVCAELCNSGIQKSRSDAARLDGQQHSDAAKGSAGVSVGSHL